ncbi:MAG: SDR family oxidoreductase [Mesorhizobium sp.]
MIPVVKAKLLEGKKGLIVGIANENSIAWGCAKAFRAFGAVTYLNDKAKKYWSFIRMAHLAEPLMKKGGTLFTMTFYGSQMVVEHYNIMGVAKAALESAVRYMAAELGPKGIRVHAISPGPLATRAASGIPEFDELLEKAKTKAPARSLASIDDVGVATAFLAHDAAKLMTGDTVYIDGGYHIID